MSDTTAAQQLLHDTMARFFESTREARNRTSLVNRGLTNAMISGENIHDVYERLATKDGDSEGDQEEEHAGNSSGGVVTPAHTDGDGAGE